MCLDALERADACGYHLREEFQAPDTQTQHGDKHFCYVSASEYTGDQLTPVLHKQPLELEYITPSQRSYK